MPFASLDEKGPMIRPEEKELKVFAYSTVAVVHFTGHTEIPITFYCIRCVIRFNSIQFNSKRFIVDKSLHYLNITKVFKYKSNIEISLDDSNPIIIVLNCEILCFKPRKFHFV